MDIVTMLRRMRAYGLAISILLDNKVKGIIAKNAEYKAVPRELKGKDEV
jgi:hypothetical protein